jgi:MFS family permease
MSTSSNGDGTRARRRAGSAGSLGPGFTRLLVAGTVSNLGDGVLFVAGPLLASSLTRDPVLVAGTVVAQRLPWLLFALLSGALVDRLDLRRVLVVADLARAMMFAALAVAVALGLSGVGGIWLLYVVFFASGCAETMFDNASTSIVPDIVAPEGLERANGRIFGARVVAEQLGGPALGGWLFAVAAVLPFAVHSAALILAAGLTALIRTRPRAHPAGPRAGLRAEIGEGVAWLRRHRLLRTVAVTIGVMNITLAATGAILVLWAQERLGLDAVGYGLLLSSTAVGGVLGGLVSGPLLARLSSSLVLRGGLVLEGLIHLALAVTTVPLVAGVVLALFGLHAVVWSVVSTSLRQALVPARLRGRVNSAYLLLAVGGTAAGGLLGGALAGLFGLTAPFWAAGVVDLVVIALAWRALGPGVVAAARAGAEAVPDVGSDVGSGEFAADQLGRDPTHGER